MNNENVVHLKTVTDIDLSKLSSLDDMKVAAANIDMVRQLEEILMQWYKQIKQVGFSTPHTSTASSLSRLTGRRNIGLDERDLAVWKLLTAVSC